MVVLLFGFGFYFATLIAPGSYANAEIFVVEMSEDSAVALIERFKVNNPQYSLRQKSGLKDGRKSYWYHFYFTVNETDHVFHAWVRASGINQCKLALVGAQDRVGDWKTINGNDIKETENEYLKNIFVDSILRRLNLPLK